MGDRQESCAAATVTVNGTERSLVSRDLGDLLALDPPMPGLQGIAWNEPDAK